MAQFVVLQKWEVERQYKEAFTYTKEGNSYDVDEQEEYTGTAILCEEYGSLNARRYVFTLPKHYKKIVNINDTIDLESYPLAKVPEYIPISNINRVIPNSGNVDTFDKSSKK